MPPSGANQGIAEVVVPALAPLGGANHRFGTTRRAWGLGAHLARVQLRALFRELFARTE